eukprot:CAMPEP_0198601574 /NCGR_PEP_ID=MMETSP1462-20131121/149688_1 /TAXON_ID=1333877 /ORGANISM="Brandtodinium nutriculum, Strain RCC3387" /LENGTH=72 /DNA_ID=CAMNT_0044333307 /DNA_START=26 /DNA_END=240 /DNA_ORIENTATION=-
MCGLPSEDAGRRVEAELQQDHSGSCSSTSAPLDDDGSGGTAESSVQDQGFSPKSSPKRARNRTPAQTPKLTP